MEQLLTETKLKCSLSWQPHLPDYPSSPAAVHVTSWSSMSWVSLGLPSAPPSHCPECSSFSSSLGVWQTLWQRREEWGCLGAAWPTLKCCLSSLYRTEGVHYRVRTGPPSWPEHNNLTQFKDWYRGGGALGSSPPPRPPKLANLCTQCINYYNIIITENVNCVTSPASNGVLFNSQTNSVSIPAHCKYSETNQVGLATTLQRFNYKCTF